MVLLQVHRMVQIKKSKKKREMRRQGRVLTVMAGSDPLHVCGIVRPGSESQTKKILRDFMGKMQART